MMAHAAVFHTAAVDTGLFATLRKRFQTYMLYRETLAQLRALSDRDLADLAIEPSDLVGTAQRAVYGA